MKKLVFLCLLFCGSIYAQDRETAGTKLSLKLQSQINGYFYDFTTLNHLGLIPAVLIETKSGYLHQIQVSQLIFSGTFGNKIISGANNANFLLRGAYEFSLPLSIFVKQELLTAFVGIGISNSVTTFSYEPNSSAEFPRGGTGYGADVYIFPTVRRALNKRFFFDCSALVYFARFGVGTSRTGDPSIPIAQQRTSSFSGSFEVFKQLALRAGFGMNF